MSKVFSFMYKGAVFYAIGVTMFENVRLADFGLRDDVEENTFIVFPITVHEMSGHYMLEQDILAKLNPFASKSITILPNPLTTEYPKLNTVLYFSCLFENTKLPILIKDNCEF
jgi:hypothetical protein